MPLDETNADCPVTLPLWVLGEVLPALLGALKVYEVKVAMGTMPQPFTQAELDRYVRAVEMIIEAMEQAGMTWGESQPWAAGQ